MKFNETGKKPAESNCMDRENQMIIPAWTPRLCTGSWLPKNFQNWQPDALVVAIRYKDVADAPDGLDIAGHGCVGFDEFAQA